MRKFNTALTLIIPLGVLLVGTPILDAATTRGKIYPGVAVATVEMGGQSQEQAQRALAEAVSSFLEDSTVLTVGQVEVRVPHQTIYAFDLDKTLADALSVGNTGTLLDKLSERLEARLSRVNLAPAGLLDQDALARELKTVLAFLHAPPRDAQFLTTFNNKQPVVSVLPEAPGKAPDFEALRVAFEAQVKTLRTAPITVVLQSVAPTMSAPELIPLIPQAKAILERTPLPVKLGDRTWKIPPATLAGWLQGVQRADQVELGLDRDVVVKWLAERAKEVERAPVDGVFELAEEGSKVTKFQIGKAGLRLLQAENVTLLEEAVRAGQDAQLLIKELPPLIAIPKAAQAYGIQELVGRGTTNFKGSPPNRVKYINRGAALLHGTLIASGDEFSLLDHLRPFTRENGYLAELVIKAAEGRTTPEIGGGLCQLGTTMFRTVLNVGLPVTARRNHSYRVSYYEPPVGMDATIYDPAPDFKFTNDTGAWLLLTAAVDTKAMNVTFELWGSKDGRIAETSTPEVSNVRKPPEKKIIETTDLPPGQTKCTEKAHIGSDARFTYKVTYADGRVEEQEFKSRYRPWQEVCLVGVEKLTTPEAPPEPIPFSPDVAAPTP